MLLNKTFVFSHCLSPSMHLIVPTVDPFVPSFISLYLLKRRKERGSKKEGGDALETLETKLRDRAETLGLSLEQKTKGMKQRDKKVTYKVILSSTL